MAAAVMFGAVACSQSDEIQEVVGGEEVVSVLSLELEDLGTRLAGDAGKIDKVAWGIYDKDGNFLAPHSSANKGVAKFEGGKAEIEVRLFTGKVYDLVFFAYCSENEAYTIDWGARQLNVSYKVNEQQQNDLANLEARDAFFHIENGFVAGPNKTFTLKRPFAQLNAGQSLEDYDNMQLTQNCIIKSKLTTEAYAAMDLKTGKVVGEKVPVVLAMNKVIDLDGDSANDHLLVGKEPNVTEYKHLSMNYLLVDDKELVDVKLNLLGNEGTNFEREYFNVPLQRNYRTNILGSLISEPSVFTIVIDAKFDGDHTAAVDPETSALEGILAPLYNQETAHVALQQNVTWTTGASHGSTPLIPANSKLKELVIEGTNITRDGVQPTITFIGNGVGPVRAANGGKIIFRNVKIVDQSVSYDEGAWELGYLEMAGNLEFENCTFVNAVMLDGGNVAFKKCHLNSNDDNQYAAWVSGGDAYFRTCTFEGARGIKVHEAYGSEVAKVVVNNCDFTLTKKPGLALGDLNAETAITIKNSTFCTQKGDQGLYIYETDTDVATFDLVLKNNTIVASTPEVGQSLLSLAKEGDTVSLPAGTYTVPATIANDVTIVGVGAETVIDAPKSQKLDGKSINFKKLTIDKSASNTNYNGFQHVNEVSYKDCVINNQIFLYGAKETFTRCTFNQTSAGAYNVWTYGAKEVIFNECTFNSAGKSILVYTEKRDGLAVVNINGCTINASAPAEGKAAIEVDSSFPNGGSNPAYAVNINSTTANGFANGNVSGNPLWNNKKGNNLTLYVNGVCYVAPTPVAENGNYTVLTSAGLQYAIANIEEGKTITLLAEGSYEGLFDLSNKNITIESSEAAEIKGLLWLNHCAPVIKGITLSNPNGVQHPNPTDSKYYNTINEQFPAVAAYNYANPRFENCVFNLVGPTVYGFYGYALNSPVFEGCTFNCNGIRPIANNGDAITVNGCTFKDQYHYSVRIFENAGNAQKVVYTNNTVQGTNTKGEFEGVNISKKGTTAVVLGDFTISGNTADLKYRHHKNVTMSGDCTYPGDVKAFEKEN